MRIRLFDVQTGFGGASQGSTDSVSADGLQAEMDRLDIGAALVRTAPDVLVHDVAAANAALFDACRDHSGWTPCPIVAPNGGREFLGEEEQVGEALANGAGAVLVRPQTDYWITAPWACDALFKAIEAHRMPVVCLNDRVSHETLGELAGRYPALPFILAGVQYRFLRVIVPLMETFTNVYLSLGFNFNSHNGIEHLVKVLGDDRLLFGTGFPDTEAAGAITMLAYAGIADEVKQRIGAENTERLIKGIRQ
ncbi:MAG: amidohydrolase family protein [bacterium]|nr:amidohydrolase family protein [bacterium]